MYAISTAAFVSILALASSLAVGVQAGKPRVQCIKDASVSTDISCGVLLAALLIDINQLQKMNPDQSCDQIIASGTVCIDALFPNCADQVTAGNTDTKCDRLAALYHISRNDFIAYNDDVNTYDCSDLVPGHMIQSVNVSTVAGITGSSVLRIG